MKRTLALVTLALVAVSAHAELVLRQATASQAVVIGPFVDSTDGNTAETGLTIDAADVRISVNGGNIVGKNSGGCTHDELGYYTCTFDATDTATVGRMQVMVHESGALPVYHEFQVVEEAVYDACCAASAAPLTAAAVASQLGTGTQFTAIPWNASWDAEVQSEATDALNAYDPPTRAELTSDINGLASTLSTIASYIDTEVAALLVGVNVEQMNGVNVIGAGTSGDKWRGGP